MKYWKYYTHNEEGMFREYDIHRAYWRQEGYSKAKLISLCKMDGRTGKEGEKQTLLRTTKGRKSCSSMIAHGLKTHESKKKKRREN